VSPGGHIPLDETHSFIYNQLTIQTNKKKKQQQQCLFTFRYLTTLEETQRQPDNGVHLSQNLSLNEVGFFAILKLACIFHIPTTNSKVASALLNRKGS